MSNYFILVKIVTKRKLDFVVDLTACQILMPKSVVILNQLHGLQQSA